MKASILSASNVGPGRVGGAALPHALESKSVTPEPGMGDGTGLAAQEAGLSRPFVDFILFPRTPVLLSCTNK